MGFHLGISFAVEITTSLVIFRLGFGGGYYDKTFSYLKKIKHKFISIAVAFDDQKIDELAHDKYDQKIDYILTEKKLYTV